MRDRAVVRTLAALVPADLRLMRARQMLESEQEFLGVDEVACPGCEGTGWLSRRRLERCPLCCGFREVPVGLADWFRAQTAETTTTTRRAPRKARTGDGGSMRKARGGSGLSSAFCLVAKRGAVVSPWSGLGGGTRHGL